MNIYITVLSTTPIAILATPSAYIRLQRESTPVAAAAAILAYSLLTVSSDNPHTPPSGTTATRSRLAPASSRSGAS